VNVQILIFVALSGKQGSKCADYNQTALNYLAGLAKSDPTAYTNAISELNDPNLVSVKQDIQNKVSSINNPSSGAGAGVGIAVFVIALVAIIAGTLYYRHRDPEGFSMKVGAAKDHMGNAWYYVKSKFSSGSSSSSNSTLPVTRPTSTPMAATVAVAVQPTVARPTPPRPTAPRLTPPASNNKPISKNDNRPVPPPKQGGSKAPLPPSAEEVQNPDEYKYTPPAKELPTKPARPTPPPKRNY